MLTLGWSDGYSFIPLDFTMLSSSKDSNRLENVSDKIDKRTYGLKEDWKLFRQSPIAYLK